MVAVARGEDFCQVPEPVQRCTVAEEDGWLPVYFHDNAVFGSVHIASFEAVAEAIPSEAITPVRLPRGRCLVGILAFRYGLVTWTAADGSALRKAPFGEVAIACPVSWHGEGPDVSARQRLRGFVLQQPVTAWRPCDDGWQLFGYPKFVADMEFTEGTRSRKVQVTEGGQELLSLEGRPGGPAATFDQNGLIYTAMGTDLVANTDRSLGRRQVRLGRDIGQFHAGDHPVGRALQRLDISPRPIAVVNYLQHSSSISELGRRVGACTPYDRYAGQHRHLGRYTVTYPGVGTIDLNAEPR